MSDDGGPEAPELDLLARRASRDLMAALPHEERPSPTALRVRHRQRRVRRNVLGVGTIAVVVLSIALVARPGLDTDSIGIVDEPAASDVPGGADGVAGSGDVILTLDRPYRLTSVDPSARTVREGAAMGVHPPIPDDLQHEPHPLVVAGDRLVTGLGTIVSTTLEGTDQIVLGESHRLVPAAEDGSVWLVDMVNGAKRRQVERVDAASGAVLEAATLPAGMAPIRGVPDGLVGVPMDASASPEVQVWRRDAPTELDRVATAGPVQHVHSSGELVAFCENDCQRLTVLNTAASADQWDVTGRDLSPGTSVASIRLSPDGRHLLVLGQGEGEVPVAAFFALSRDRDSTRDGLELVVDVPLAEGWTPQVVEWSTSGEDVYVGFMEVGGTDDAVWNLQRIGLDGSSDIDQAPGVFVPGGATVVVRRSATSVPPETAAGLRPCVDSRRTAGGCTWAPVDLTGAPTPSNTSDDVLILRDQPDTVAYIAPTTGSAATGVQVAGDRPGDHPFQVIATGGRLVVGWGEIYSTSLDGSGPLLLGRAEYAVPGAENGTVWLVDYQGDRIGPGAPTVRHVQVHDGAVIAEGTLPAGFSVAHGVPGGLAVLREVGALPLHLWDPAEPDRLIEVSPRTLRHVTQADSLLAFCESDEPDGREPTTCDRVAVVDVARPGEVSVVESNGSADETVQAESIQLSPDGTYVTFAVSLGDQPEGGPSQLVVAEIDRSGPEIGIGDVARLLPLLDSVPLWVRWSATASTVHVAVISGADDGSAVVRLLEMSTTGRVLRDRDDLPISLLSRIDPVVVPRDALDELPDGSGQ